MLSKLIKPHHIEEGIWQQSSVYKDIISFISAMSSSVVGTKRSYIKETHISQHISSIIDDLETIDDNVSVEAPSSGRFGHKNFRTYISRITEQLPTLVSSRIETSHPHELATYLMNSFGDFSRIDYGTGHELNFVFFLFALYKQSLIKTSDLPSIALHTIQRYLHFCYHLQDKYRLEPAGSQGVYSFDDFHILGFVIGSFQMRGNEDGLTPKSVADPQVRLLYSHDYLLLDCFQRTFSSKSNVDVSHLPVIHAFTEAVNWKKCANGMISFYKDHVLNQYPIVQHCLFGELVSLDFDQ
ncbi:hypothetical protein P9112_002689 [Eukaryota sp. TZLM1-RC]